MLGLSLIFLPHILFAMNILALVLLCLGALAVLVTAPFALFMPYKAFDDTERPVLVFLSVALFLVVPLSMGWCLYNAWQYYGQAEYFTAVQFAAYPAVGLVLVILVITIATLRTKTAVLQKPSESEKSSEPKPADESSTNV